MLVGCVPKVGTSRPLLPRATCCTPQGPAGCAGGNPSNSLKQLIQLLHPQCAEVAVEVRSKHQSVSSRSELRIFYIAFVCECSILSTGNLRTCTHTHINTSYNTHIHTLYTYTNIIYTRIHTNTHTYTYTHTHIYIHVGAKSSSLLAW